MGRNPIYDFNENALIAGLSLLHAVRKAIKSDEPYVAPKPKYNKGLIEFKPVTLTPEYAKKWQTNLTDYLQIYKDGKLLRPTLYRIGGIGGDWKDGFIMVLKCEESHYSKEIMEMSEAHYKKEGLEYRSNHLSNNSCIIDENGDERFVSNSSSAYLHKGGIYSVGGKYYNARNNELYCDSSTTIITENFTFLHNQWDNDKTRRGVLKINHANGLYEIIN